MNSQLPLGAVRVRRTTGSNCFTPQKPKQNGRAFFYFYFLVDGREKFQQEKISDHKFLYYVERKQKEEEEAEISGFSSRIRAQSFVSKRKLQLSIFNTKLFIVTV